MRGPSYSGCGGCGPPRSRRDRHPGGRALRAGVLGAIVALSLACGSGVPDDADTPDLSSWTSDGLLRARVVENVTACEVDADCYLLMEFADTTMIARYGTGERPAPPCPVSREVSDAAWYLVPGDLIQVRLHDCGDEGYFIEELTLAP